MVVLTVLLATDAGCQQQHASPIAGVIGKTGPTALTMLGEKTPPHPDFGPGTQTFAFSIAFSASTAISDAYSWPDGTLLVVRDTNDPPGSQRDIYSLATLDRGIFKTIPSPRLKDPKSYFNSFNLACGSVGENPIVCADEYNGPETFYVAEHERLVPTKTSRGAVIVPDWTLPDGDTCTTGGLKDAPSIAVWTVDRNGRKHPFITNAVLDRASGMAVSALLKRIDIHCGHIGAIGLLSISNQVSDGAVYTIGNDAPRMAARGSLLTSGMRHALVEWEDMPHDRIDYLEVFGR